MKQTSLLEIEEPPLPYELLLCCGAAKTPANKGRCVNGGIRSAKVFKVFIAPLSSLIKLRAA